MALKPVFTGIAYPYTRGANGLPAVENDIELVKSDLALLLNTRKTERVMLPDFGLDLERLIFDNTGPLLRAKAVRQVIEAINNYEPRVEVVSVEVTEPTPIEVNISIIYRIRGLTQELSLEFNRGAA